MKSIYDDMGFSEKEEAKIKSQLKVIFHNLIRQKKK